MVEPAVGFPRRRARRILPIFLAGSIAAHAAVLVILPALEPGPGPVSPGVFEVVVLPPQPLPMAQPDPEPQPEARRTDPQRKTARAPQRSDAPPVVALTEPQAPAESGFSVPAPTPADPPAAPEQKSQVASTPSSVTGAAYLRNPAPIYPMAARRAGEQGTVILRVLVTTEGLPARVDLQKSSGSTHLDRAAIETVKGWRFRPARRGSEAVEGWVDVPVVFNLKEAS